MEKDYTKTIFIGILCLLLLQVAENFMIFFIPTLSNNYVENTANAFKLISIILLLSYGTFYNSKPYFRFALGCYFIIVIGVMLKIMHWPMSNIFLSIGILSVPLIYFIFFIMKPKKKLLDYLKALFVITYYLAVCLKIFHLPGSAPLFVSETLIFDIMLTVFVIDYYNNLKAENSLNEI